MPIQKQGLLYISRQESFGQQKKNYEAVEIAKGL
jgi:hypothetical protein